MQDGVTSFEARVAQMKAILTSSVPEGALNEAANFLAGLLHIDASLRCSVATAVHHPFVCSV